MLQLSQFWTGISLRQQIIIGVATLGMFVAVLFAARTTLSPDMALLYSGLDASSAGEVVASLEQQGVGYEVRSGSIYVTRPARDRLRMVLASEGLPSNGSAGYELLDGLSGFGTTSQMFDAAYWRAKEGELARTISASPGIRAARVHIAQSNPRPFQQGSDSAASVSVTPNGETLTNAQARALRFLVASAVPGLSPQAVTIIDGRTGMLIEGGDHSGSSSNTERAVTLRRNVMRLVEAHVGIGNAVVEVNVEHISEQETLIERRFDPEERVIISTESTEKSRSNEGGSGNGGTVSVASNLPDGEAAGAGGSGSGASSAENETREIVNFEVSETTREILRTPGSIKRISVAVLVNGIESQDADGVTTYSERPPEEIEALEQLVSSVVGYDPERGDTVTIKSMNLDRSGQLLGTDAGVGPSFFQDLDAMKLIQLAVLAAVTLVLGLFVVRPILNPAPVQQALASPHEQGRLGVDANGMALESGRSNLVTNSISTAPDQNNITSVTTQSGERSQTVISTQNGESGTADDLDFEFPAMAAVDTAFVDPNMMISDGAEEGVDPDTNDAVIRLRNLVASRRTEALEVLRGWLDQDQTDEKETASL